MTKKRKSNQLLVSTSRKNARKNLKSNKTFFNQLAIIKQLSSKSIRDDSSQSIFIYEGLFDALVRNEWALVTAMPTANDALTAAAVATSS